MKEKAGLLPPRPDTEGIKEKSDARGRRPADVWLPRWCGNGAVALDFAVTSGLRADNLHESAIDHNSAVTSYEASKRAFLQTEAQCAEQGLSFTPMVMEAHGGSWGPAAKQALKVIAKELANVTGLSVSEATTTIAQRLSTTLHRANARAIVRRLVPVAPAETSCNSAAWLPDPMDDA